MSSNQPPKKDSKGKVIFKAIYTTVMAFYAIYGFVQAYQAWAKFRDLSKGFNNIVSNWQEEIITDLTVTSAGAECPTGLNPFVFEWPGTMDGCDCRTASSGDLSAQNLTSTLYTRACNSTMSNIGCGSIAATPSKSVKQIPVTGGTGNGQQICIQRAQGISFIKNAELLKADGTCSKGQPCGGISSASADNGMFLMCVEGSTCPVLDVKIEAGFANPGGVYTDEGDLGVVGVTNKVWTSKTGTDLPLAELIASVSHVCKNHNDVSYYGGAKNYALLKTTKRTQYTCEGGADGTFTKYVEFGLQEALDENSVDLTPVDLAGIISSGSKNIGLFGRSFIPFRQTCRDKVKEMEDNDSKVDSMRSAQTGLFAIAATVAIVIGFFFTLISVWLMLYKAQITTCCTKWYHKCKNIKTCRKILGLVLKCINAIFLIWAVIVSSGTKSFFKEVGDLKCSNTAYNALLTDFSDQVDEFVYSKNLKAIISFGVMILVEILKLILGKVMKKKKGAPKNPSPGGAPVTHTMKPGQITPIGHNNNKF